MVRVADHPGVAGLRAGWRAGRDAMPARHIRVIRLLAGGAELRRGGAAERLRSGASFGGLRAGGFARGACRALQPVRAVEPRRPSPRQRRQADPPDAGGACDAARAGEDPARRRRGMDGEEGGGGDGRRSRTGLGGPGSRGREALRAIGRTFQRPRPRHVRPDSPRGAGSVQENAPKSSPRRPRATPGRSSPPGPGATAAQRIGLKPVTRRVRAPRGNPPVAPCRHRFEWLWQAAEKQLIP